MPIEVNDLSFAYHKRQSALQKVSFLANRGELVAVLGANGAGKSTLFRCILGLLHGYEGQVKICNRDVRTLSRAELSRMVAYIPQSTVPVFNYTVLDMVLMGTTGSLNFLSSPGKQQTQAAHDALGELGVDNLAARGFGQLSGGERQLVLIARAMAQRAKILVMDEPTANLDYGNQYRVMEKIRTLADKSYTVLLSTHNPEHALRFAHKVLALQKGGVLCHGETEKVLTGELVDKLYRLEAQIHTLDTPKGEVRVCIPE